MFRPWNGLKWHNTMRNQSPLYVQYFCSLFSSCLNLNVWLGTTLPYSLMPAAWLGFKLKADVGWPGDISQPQLSIPWVRGTSSWGVGGYRCWSAGMLSGNGFPVLSSYRAALWWKLITWRAPYVLAHQKGATEMCHQELVPDTALPVVPFEHLSRQAAALSPQCGTFHLPAIRLGFDIGMAWQDTPFLGPAIN